MGAKRSILRNIKLTEGENTLLKADAYAHGMNMSQYLRWLVLKERGWRVSLVKEMESAIDRAMAKLNIIYECGHMLPGDWQALHEALSDIYPKSIAKKE